ncbi:MAG: hypothetical protein GXO39_03810, partial [Thermotogae bacterium]|nr:hypothetical protein [Thermotogota bacterium]
MMLLSVGFVWAYVDRSEIRPQLPNDNVSVMSDGSSYTEGLYYMGDTVGLSEYDYPRNAHFKFIQVYENTGSIHITYMRTQTGVQDTRTMFYNFYDPTASSWIDNVGVDAMDATNFGKNGFGDIFLTGDGRAIISAHLNTTSPLISKYGIEDSYLSASFTHYDSPSGPATGSCYYPSVLQTSEGFIFICTDGDGTDPDTNYVFYSSDGTTWNQVFAISQVFPERFDLDYNPAINTAVIAYFEEGGTNESSAIKYRISTDGG